MKPIQGRYEAYQFKYLKVTIKGCQIPEDDPQGRKCAPLDEVVSKMSTIAIVNSHIDLRPEVPPEKQVHRFVDFTNFVSLDPNKN